jgi:hypothetical protein
MQMPPTMNPPRPPVPDELLEPKTEREDAMQARLKRLARPHRSGGWVIERATLLAGGSAFDGAVAWIAAHRGVPEMPAPPRTQRGLHSPRAAETGTPLRFVLPADALR